MTANHTYGRTKSGEPVTDEMIEHLADEAERYEPGQLQDAAPRSGSPSVGSWRQVGRVRSA